MADQCNNQISLSSTAFMVEFFGKRFFSSRAQARIEVVNEIVDAFKAMGKPCSAEYVTVKFRGLMASYKRLKKDKAGGKEVTWNHFKSMEVALKDVKGRGNSTLQSTLTYQDESVSSNYQFRKRIKHTEIIESAQFASSNSQAEAQARGNPFMYTETQASTPNVLPSTSHQTSHSTARSTVTRNQIEFAIPMQKRRVLPNQRLLSTPLSNQNYLNSRCVASQVKESSQQSSQSTNAGNQSLNKILSSI